MERFNEIDIVKGIAMLTVLWHHSFILYLIYMLDITWCHHAMAINETYFLNVFFLISGYLFAFSKKRSYLENLKGKLNRLLVPYLSYSAATLGVKLLAPNLVNRKVESIGAYMDTLILKGGELWFVYVLFLIYVIWPWVLQHTKIKHLWGIVAILFVADILVPEGFLNDVFLYKRIIHFSIFFVMGYAMKKIGRGWLKDNILFIVFSILFVMLCCILVQVLPIPYVSGYINAFVGCGFIWMLSYRLINKPILCHALTFIGKYSLPFYWLNGFVLVMARTIVVKGMHMDSSVSIVLSIFVLCVLLETLIVLTVKRYPRVGWLIGF